LAGFHSLYLACGNHFTTGNESYIVDDSNAIPNDNPWDEFDGETIVALEHVSAAASISRNMINGYITVTENAQTYGAGSVGTAPFIPAGLEVAPPPANVVTPRIMIGTHGQ
jgi:hypothetical protein